MEWKYLVIVVSAVLLLLLVIKELKRKNNRNVVWRVIASTLAVLALTLIALPPTYKSQIKQGSLKNFVLLTEGFNKDSISKFSDPVLITEDQAISGQFLAEKPLLVPSIDYYIAQNPDIKTLHILGHGLAEENLKSLRIRGVEIRYNGAEPGFGIQNVHWTGKLRSGEALTVSGKFNNSFAKPLKLVLRGLSSNLDSIVIKKNSQASFKLNTIPRQLGLGVYELLTMQDEDTLGMEKLPFEVEKIEPLKVLILSSSPDFEVNFLKNWLAENRFSVAARTGISKEKFSTEFLNMSRTAINLQSRQLDEFDLVISDESSLVQLTSAERVGLKNRIDEGLGLLIRNEDEISTHRTFGQPFSTAAAAPAKDLNIKLPEISSSISVPGVGVNFINAQNGDQPLFRDESGGILVNSKMSGLGRIVFSTINNSYAWKLAGKNAEYQAFWSRVIEKASRKITADQDVFLEEQFPLRDSRNTVVIQTDDTSIPDVFYQNTAIPLKQNPELFYQWTGNIWPTKAGWNTITAKNNLQFSWYVFEPDDWKSTRNAESSVKTMAYANNSGLLAAEDAENRTVQSRVPVIIFYLLFLLCCAFLWIETKFL